MTTILFALLPDGILIALGAGLRHRLSAEIWNGLDRLNFTVLFPALLFHTVARDMPGMVDAVTIGLGVWLIIAAGFLLAFLLRPYGPRRFLDFAGLWQTAWRFNSAIALVAVQALPPETAGLMSVAIGCAVPLANLLAVAVLSRGNGIGFLGTVKMVALNPFFLASFGGLIFGASGGQLPEIVKVALAKLAGAAVPLALLSIGAAINLRAMLKMTGLQTGLNMVKLVLLPVLTCAVAYGAGLPTGVATILIIFAALPTASAAHVLASAFGAERSEVATQIAQSTALACITLPIWVFLAS